MKKLVGILIGVAGFAAAAQAQTVTTAFDQDITVDPIATGSIPFTVSAPGSSLYIEGLASVNSAIQGFGTLTEAGVPSFSENFVLDPSVTGDYFNTATLGAGSYSLAYTLIDSPFSTPDTVNIEGTLTSAASAPEISAASAASGLTLLAGALLILRGRRRPLAVSTFA